MRRQAFYEGKSEWKGGIQFMKISLFTFTIVVKKRKETLVEAIRNERLREIQNNLMDMRAQLSHFHY